MPALEHRPSQTSWPCMVAAVLHHGQVMAVHRTFLRRDGAGKAPVQPAKMSLGPVGGGAVQLTEAGHQLVVAEGTETALALLQATGMPIWAALSAGGIRTLDLPPLPLAAKVTIGADHDHAGVDAAYAAAERWHHEGRRVRIALPPKSGSDFNDLLLAETFDDSA